MKRVLSFVLVVLVLLPCARLAQAQVQFAETEYWLNGLKHHVTTGGIHYVELTTVCEPTGNYIIHGPLDMLFRSSPHYVVCNSTVYRLTPGPRLARHQNVLPRAVPTRRMVVR